MCGRAFENYTQDELEARFRAHARGGAPKPTFNLAPTQLSPVVLAESGEIVVRPMRWGLVPFWAKSPKDAARYSLINARAEEIDVKRSYRESFACRRCIVPLSGFYEWKREQGGSKRPFAARLRTDPIMCVAGVWERWRSKETDEALDSFSIVTTGANAAMKAIHDRMPAILRREDETAWLDPGNRDAVSLKGMLRSCPSEWMEIYEISTLVNSPRNDRPELLAPR